MPFKISMKISITILGCLGPRPGVSASALTSTGEMICRSASETPGMTIDIGTGSNYQPVS